MRKLGIVVTAIACLMVAAVSFAADAPAAGAMTFGVNGGVMVPSGDFGDAAKLGFGGGVYGDYMINEQFAIGIDAGYLMADPKDDYLTLLKGAAEDLGVVDYTVDISNSIIPITAHAKWLPTMKDSKIAPYVVVGGGFYMMKAKWTTTGKLEGVDIGTSSDVTENKPGAFGGAGVDFKVNPQFKVGVFANMHDIFTEGTSTMFFTAGVNLGFMVGGK
jgi:outer membrane protein W